MTTGFSFGDADVPMTLLRQRAHNMRWATLPEDVIPLTAADPDFAVAPVVREAIVAYAHGGVFSYGPAEGLADFRRVCADARRRSGGDSPYTSQIIYSAMACCEVRCEVLASRTTQSDV